MNKLGVNLDKVWCVGLVIKVKKLRNLHCFLTENGFIWIAQLFLLVLLILWRGEPLYSKPKGAGAGLPVYSHTPADAMLSSVLGDNLHNNNVHHLDGGIPTN